MRIEWTTQAGRLAAVEPGLDEVAAHRDALAYGYNHPDNAELLGHAEPISPDQVVEHWAELRAAGARAFLLFRDGRLLGDADLRRFRDDAAEFAFMIGAPDAQGKGLGTRFAIMLHAFGFRQAGLQRIYVSIVPHNAASRRVFEKLGYRVDDAPGARAWADAPDDVVLSLDRPTFERMQGAALEQIRISD